MKRLCLFLLFITGLWLYPLVAFSQDYDDTPSEPVQTSGLDESWAVRGHWFIEARFSASIITDRKDSSYFSETLAGSMTVGYGLTQNLTLLVHVEQNGWHSEEYDAGWKSGVFNIGIGLDYQVFAPNVHIAALLGPSILTFDTAFDEAGETGMFFDFAPLIIHWPVHKNWVITFSAFGIHIDMPVTHNPMLEYLQYRTSLGVMFVL